MTEALERTTPLRLGFIGCGSLASHYHLPAIAAIPEWSLCALCSRNPERLRAQATRFAVDATFLDFHRMLDSCALDAVGIVGPPALHVEAARACLERQIPFMTEKPLATSLLDTRQLAMLALEKGDCGMVGFTSRYAPAQRVAWRISRQPDFGSLTYVRTGHLTMAAMLPDWGLDDPLECFLWMHGIHAIDLWRYFGGDPTRVRATLSGFRHRGINACHSGSIQASFDGKGVLHGCVHMKAGASHNGDIHSEVMGEWTRVCVENNQTVVFEHEPDWVRQSMADDVLRDVIPPDASAGHYLDVTGLAAPTYYPDFFRFEWLAFARHLMAGVALQPSIVDAYHTACLTDAIYTSLVQDGNVISVDYAL